MNNRSLHVVLVAGEVKPYSKTGGLGDVTGALPPAIAANEHKVTVFTPLHNTIDTSHFGLKKIRRRVKMSIGASKYYFNIWRGSMGEHQKIYFIDHYEFFRSRKKLYGYPKDGNLRYYFFNKAVLDTIRILKLDIDVIHCHDWHAGLIPNLLKTEEYRKDFADVASVMTIHNILFQNAKDITRIPRKHADDGKGLPQESKREIAKLNFMLRGIMHADIISTVSEQYAKEIQTKEYGYGLEDALYKRRKRLFGILNGIDYAHFDPSHDKYLDTKYHLPTLNLKHRNKMFLQNELGLDKDDNVPIIGIASRITEQKGFELIFEIMDQLMSMHLQIAIVGSGQDSYEKLITKYNRKYPEKIGIKLEFSEEIASWIYAGSDMFLMPSRFEPCGLGQMIALRYGTIPIVHKTGGLADTITDFNPKNKNGNGFVFDNYNSLDLLQTITRSLETFKYRERWEKLMRFGMNQSYSWELPAKQYIKLYRIARKRHKSG